MEIENGTVGNFALIDASSRQRGERNYLVEFVYFLNEEARLEKSAITCNAECDFHTSRLAMELDHRL